MNSYWLSSRKLETDKAAFGVYGIESIKWVEPKLVCEVIYQEVTRDCKLRAPRLHTLRTDKEPSEFTIDQIEGKGRCFST